MPDEITFFDLVSLIKIKPGMTVEKYGGQINSSFFDGARVLGTLQQKKLISLSTQMPDQNPISTTETGTALIAEADTKAKQDFDHLDLEILTQMSKGKNTPEDIGQAVNVRSRDLAMHLYRVVKQDYATYEFVSGNVDIMLTEKGFAQVKVGMPVKPQPMPQPGAVMSQPTTTKSVMMQPPEMLQQRSKPSMAEQTMQAAQQPQGTMPPAEEATTNPEGMPEMPKGKSNRMIIIAAVIIIIIIILGYLYYAHII